MPLDASWAESWIRLSAQVVAEHREELTALDTAIGDGDHGTNLERGMRAAVAALEDAGELPTPGAVLKLTATILISTVGGAAGPLIGTAFLRAAREADAPVLDAPGAARMVSAACEGVLARGHAEAGDKTMVDAWAAAARAAQEAVTRVGQCEDAPAAVLEAAAEAAAAGASATEPMRARRGRASYLGERSRGHRDPGAESTSLILAAAALSARRACEVRD
ncbi:MULTISPECIES: dihydroxyacetone kinase subunit DhaL [unclassified Actinomyces]|uniref:dihydroxyacetone kinase subunit DhaL n=1 Tax=unclassified Actinomyces TaxID=2609248 RepID=UPI0020173337|nr:MULTISPECIES: dihydroxyacetone kinase subunit DhaL [unclassified Actinomyces]MCL3777969.1 dihydroxyacetone kinase subunit L [Actinomyces sp. AC-20-1]MCL3789931.1 dihydroxyacetone kinase subunit L [Actinomyces sp. 187325]MCL3792147.1 dihydroxyacetone kinase subunit L [Actinomyces sp. 186855]MCL3794895.1 dihydroxyacetone kinase subunit L [Actinomyces sp. 217892]